MNIDELIKELGKARVALGNVPVLFDTEFTHAGERPVNFVQMRNGVTPRRIVLAEHI